MSIKVFICDDHDVVRHGLRYLIKLAPGIDIVGEAATGEECIRHVAKLKPHITILDISMPGMSGLEVAKQILKMTPRSKIIFLTMHFLFEYIQEAIRIGANGYILKDSVGDEIIDAIFAVSKGNNYMSKKVADYLWKKNYLEANELAGTNKFLKLSKRELEILKFLGDGKTNREIAEILFLSPKTIETYRSRLMDKLGMDNFADLIKFSIKQGITSINGM